ncbi:hypothetical protein F9L16_03890 [Agarivorans sp. B2Z047]|uniref:hypothetical protein n=1 Tax=Agarivorans sp. B2Z047 TaxID=2652721 RepID=UPI00128B20F2|nr:hypothetical protein [Agarivorans sp. B2Z047]MPW28137.1 hypothetical protein [Agarivorans sp. B2Z047]UQN44032.1 hypothetical protein LQZ07_06040 [Agarivorans sp. B2Z047]
MAQFRFIWLLLFTSTFSQAAWQQQWHLELDSGFASASNSPVFDSEDQWFGDAALRWFPQYGNVQGQLVALSQAKQKQDNQHDLIVAELFWKTELAERDLLVGKQRIDLGVSYGFRPLDMFLPYRRNPVAIQVEEGVGVLSLSQFSGNGEYALFYTDSYLATESEGLQQRGLGLRWYQLNNDSEWQAISYYDNKRALNLGGTWVTTFGDAWELHAESRYQQHYQCSVSQLNSSNIGQVSPVIEQEFNHGFQALIGMTWANLNGDNLILEYWFDNRALNQTQWQHVADISYYLQQQSGDISNLRFSQGEVFNGQNLLQHNVMLHWHRDIEDWQPAFDLMLAPEDGGVIATARLDYEFSQGWTLGARLRYLGGASDAVYSLLPENKVGLIKLEGLF